MLKAIAKLLFSKQMKMHETHAALVARLGLDEAILAHNEITYGYFQAVVPHWLHAMQYQLATPDKGYKQVEIATTLYQHIMRLRGTPITLREKTRYRVGLTSAVGKILRDRTTNLSERTERAETLMAPYVIEFTEARVDDRSKLDDVLFEMNRAVP